MEEILNATEAEERTFLKELIQRLELAINRIDEDVRKRADELKKEKRYLQENKAGMDHVEKISVRQSISQSALIGEAAVAKKSRIYRLLPSPYFGRVDFLEKSASTALSLYIGLHSYYDEETHQNIIHDWRAPVSSMFYDFELGEAHYESPGGTERGKITLKRQYRIVDGEMEFMLESSMQIFDDVLQKELSRSADDKMKNIVATIQRDQNSIIRDEDSRILIIQGVAGSGKTSIALHRVAFLLYRFKESIRSKDLLILSPNKVFADYISNVLPELGEEVIPEKGVEELVTDLLEGKYKFQTFFEQVSLLLEKDNEAFRERIRFKSGAEFLNLLNQYLVHIENHYFNPEEFILKRHYIVPAWFIKERFEAYHRLPMLKRFNEVVRDIEGNIKLYYKYEIKAEERTEIRKKIEGMCRETNLRKIYREFFNWSGKTHLFKLAKNSRMEYSDVFPMIYLKSYLEGIQSYSAVKHLLIDEMQDYTAVQYAVISKLFNCKMTILGDANQSVNPYSSSSAEDIGKIFADAQRVVLNKSYRSTSEIARFAQKISPNDQLEVVERHGEDPDLLGFRTADEELSKIVEMIEAFENSDHQSLGILLKTARSAKKFHEKLREKGLDHFFITEKSKAFKMGTLVTHIHLAKGLEFDRVIVPQFTEKNYRREVDRSMLYIACTRAMHRLALTYSGKVSPLSPA